jgi:hypothetical protein
LLTQPLILPLGQQPIGQNGFLIEQMSINQSVFWPKDFEPPKKWLFANVGLVRQSNAIKESILCDTIEAKKKTFYNFCSNKQRFFKKRQEMAEKTTDTNQTNLSIAKTSNSFKNPTKHINQFVANAKFSSLKLLIYEPVYLP